MQTGKQQLFELGAYLRRRYNKLLPIDGSYDPDNIYVQSTDKDRSLASASYCLAGMFPPKKQQIWNRSLMWQAIPIHTIPVEFDHILAVRRPCPLYSKVFNDYIHSAEIQSAIKRNKSMLEYIQRHAGVEFLANNDFLSFFSICQTLLVEHQRNLP